MSLVSVHNEWDPLEEIIIGTAQYARFPKEDLGFTAVVASFHNQLPNLDLNMSLGKIPQHIIDETEDDLNQLAQILQKMGVTVRRPQPIKFDEKIKTLYWEAEHYFNYCPRDTLLAIGKTIIETPNVYRSRYYENFAYKNLFVEYLQSGSRWISAPTPSLKDNDYSIKDNNSFVLNNHEPIFEAANIIRAGKDLFYLISDGGNELGFRWLQNTLGDEYRVHTCQDFYTSLHLDSTICLLRPGLMLLNPERVKKSDLPLPLQKWDAIFAPDMATYQYSDDCEPLSSVWLGMNLLMVNPNLAIVDSHQKDLIKLLEQNQIDVAPVTIRHGRSLAGGVHCVTLDVRRKGIKEDYFS